MLLYNKQLSRRFIIQVTVSVILIIGLVFIGIKIFKKDNDSDDGGSLYKFDNKQRDVNSANKQRDVNSDNKQRDVNSANKQRDVNSVNNTLNDNTNFVRLLNNGYNTCFCSSVLQCLYHLKSFRDYILDFKFDRDEFIELLKLIESQSDTSSSDSQNDTSCRTVPTTSNNPQTIPTTSNNSHTFYSSPIKISTLQKITPQFIIENKLITKFLHLIFSNMSSLEVLDPNPHYKFLFYFLNTVFNLNPKDQYILGEVNEVRTFLEHIVISIINECIGRQSMFNDYKQPRYLIESEATDLFMIKNMDYKSCMCLVSVYPQEGVKNEKSGEIRNGGDVGRDVRESRNGGVKSGEMWNGVNVGRDVREIRNGGDVGREIRNGGVKSGEMRNGDRDARELKNGNTNNTDHNNNNFHNIHTNNTNHTNNLESTLKGYFDFDITEISNLPSNLIIYPIDETSSKAENRILLQEYIEIDGVIYKFKSFIYRTNSLINASSHFYSFVYDNNNFVKLDDLNDIEVIKSEFGIVYKQVVVVFYEKIEME